MQKEQYTDEYIFKIL